MSGSTVNAPRFRVTMNGTLLHGVKSVSATLPFNFQPGRFSFVKAFTPNDAFPASWWAATASKTMLVAIELSNDGRSFQQIITGNLDSHLYDPIQNVIAGAGRDLAASMCDERIVATYRNLTASQIAAQFASEHGLQTSITATTELAGRVYDQDHDETHSGDFSQATNEWDLLCRLGSQAGIMPYVLGNTLYFNPPPASPPTFQINFVRNPSGQLVSNVEQLRLERHLTLARDVSVTVRSWNSRKKKTYTATVRTKTKAPSTDPTEPTSKYLVVQPNLTQAQCLQKAQQLALDYSQHERIVTAAVPSLALMTPDTVIQVTGTGTDYDMTYYQQGVSYTLDFENGAHTSISAKFSSDLYLYDDDTGEQIGESPNY
jgi:phage protein D